MCARIVLTCTPTTYCICRLIVSFTKYSLSYLERSISHPILLLNFFIYLSLTIIFTITEYKYRISIGRSYEDNEDYEDYEDYLNKQQVIEAGSNTRKVKIQLGDLKELILNNSLSI